MQNENFTSNEQNNNLIKMRKSVFALFLVIVIVITTLIVTLIYSKYLSNDNNQLGEYSKFNKLFAVYHNLDKAYFEQLDEEQLIDGAINGMIDALDDPYTQYMDIKEAKSFHDSINSSFEGIGAEVQELEGYIVIVSPIKGSPAEKAGLLPNDKVLAADEVSLQGLSATEAVNYIRGEKGTKVKLTIDRPGIDGTMDIEIVRDTIPIETVYSEMVDDKIAKVQVTSFSEHTTTELIEQLTELKSKGMEGLILDLRHNPGGLLPRAIEITSLFVPEGEVIFKVEDRAGNVEEHKSIAGEKFNGKVVVLVNKGSASASEILAGAVSEAADIPLVGEKTFGKGTVQNAQDFKDGSNLKMTTAKWLTPNGNWIHKEGIKPDYEVNLPEYASLPFLNPDLKMKESDASVEVKVAQQMLDALSYDIGNEDGIFGEKTKLAVMKLQKDNNLKETGILTGETTIRLMEQLRDKITNNDTQLEKAIEILKQQIK